MDERIYRIVMSRPIPIRLAEALERAPDLTVHRTASRAALARKVGIPSMDPDDMKPIFEETLELICHGYSNREIAERTYWSIDTVRERTKALFATFDARNRAHLAALAVAQGYVDMKIAV